MSERKKIPNLLLIAGEGTKSGKTTAACRIIELMPGTGITAVKITNHFHETTPGLVLLKDGEGYAIYRETDAGSDKDSSRMLKAGAENVYFIKAWDASIAFAFDILLGFLPAGTAVICESIALAGLVEPGVLVITSSDVINKRKDISHLWALPHVKIKYEKLALTKEMPFSFTGSEWVITTGPSLLHR